jgi:hypothetical protein
MLAASPALAQSSDEATETQPLTTDHQGGESSGFTGFDAAAQEAISSRLGYLPLRLESVDDPRVAEALRVAPARPDRADLYRGDDQAMEVANQIRARAPWFLNMRSTAPLATWNVSQAQAWRVRTTEECHARLRELGIGFVPYEPEDEGFLAPAPVLVRSRVGGVRFTSATGEALMSCELAARLPTIARVVAHYGVTRVALSSIYRPEPAQSFHSFGMGVDIHRMQVEVPLPGPDGETSSWLSVRDDFVETPDLRTCDPSLLGEDSSLGENERGRLLLAIACELFESGDFATVLTPNYNEGHRGHFHIDIRPDDPRAFIR